MQFDKLTTQPFSFFNFSKKKTPKFKHVFFKFINAFLLVQFLLLNLQLINIYKYSDNAQKESIEIFEHYDKLQKALKKGEQENIIYEFINLKSKGLVITDLLSAGFMLMKDIEKIPTEDSYKIDKSTHKTLDIIFEKMSDTGYQKDKNNLNELFSCVTIDFSCMTISYLMKDNIQSILDSVRLKSQIATYDAQHHKEYKEFISKIEKNPPDREFIKSPGQLYFENKNTK